MTEAHPRFGPIRLESGVGHRHVLTFFYAAIITIAVNSGIAVLQPYLLTENLRIPFEEQGRASSVLVLAAELVVIPMIAVFGGLSDRIGRRVVYSMGFAWIAAGFMLLPLATSLTGLVAARMFTSVGIAAIGSMLATVLADYPQDPSRGLMAAAAGICNGIGAFLAAMVLSQLPSQFAGMGYDSLESGRLTYSVAAGVALVSALIVYVGLKPGVPGGGATDIPLPVLLRQGLRAARNNNRLLVAYLGAFAARGDMAVIGTYFSLWAKQAGLDQGLTIEEALKQAGIYIAIIQGSILFWAPVWGFVLDRLDRLTAVCLTMLVAVCGYAVVGFSDSPVGPTFIPAALMLGCAEVGAILSGQVLVGQEAPEAIRGSVVGLFMLIGTIGLLAIGVAGGFVFDGWSPGGVFILVAGVNAVVLVVASLVRWSEMRDDS